MNNKQTENQGNNTSETSKSTKTQRKNLFASLGFSEKEFEDLIDKNVFVLNCLTEEIHKSLSDLKNLGFSDSNIKSYIQQSQKIWLELQHLESDEF